MNGEPARVRPRHLIDPEQLRRPNPTRAEEKAALERVQRWVLSTLAVTTILHLSAGLVVAAWVTDQKVAGARPGLLVLAGLFGMMAVASGLAIHRKSTWSGWLLAGWIPTLVGLVAMRVVGA
jgi:hypothetical protein